MTKPIEDSTNAAAIRTALDVPTTADLNAKYTKPSTGIPATDLDADQAGRTLLTATSAAERKQVLGLDQVNNTSDANKPISTAQQTALDAKMAATLPAMQAVLDAGTAQQKAAFLSSVSYGSGNTVFGIGNSIMRTQTPSRNGASWLELCSILSQGAMKLLGQAGVNGDTTAMILARLATDALSNPAKYIIWSELTNDAIQNVPIATSRANVTAINAAIFGAGKIPIMVAAPPKTSRNIWRYNAAARAACIAQNVAFINPWDIVTANGLYTDATMSIDGTHTTPKANRLGADVLWGQLSKIFIGSPDISFIDTDPDGLITSNALFLANTSGVPTGWVGAAGVTHSIETGVAPVQGNWWKQTAAGISSSQISSRSGLALPSGWVAGDTVRMSCRIRTVGVQANGSSGNTTYAGQGKMGVYVQLNWGGGGSLLLRELSADIDGVYSVDGVIPATVTSTHQIVVALVATAASSGEVSISQLNVHNLSLMGRI